MTATTVSSENRLADNFSSRLSIQNILVPVDFSPASENAWNYAFRFAKKFGARLTLLHVLSPEPLLAVSGISVASSGSAIAKRSAAKSLRTLAAHTANGSAAKVECATPIGIPSHEIVEYAKEHGADLIIMATHGYTGWKHFCIGSTAERVVRAAPCAVMVVREKEHELV